MRESDLIDFVQFVEEETLLINDPLFSREPLHDYAGQEEKVGNAKHKKLKNCYSKPKEKVTQNQSSVNPRKKCVFCDGSHEWDNCQFYTQILAEDRSKFLRENKLCYGCFEEISTQHTARSCKNRGTCKICKEKHPKVYVDLHLKGRANQGMIVLILMIRLLKVIMQVMVVQQLTLVK